MTTNADIIRASYSAFRRGDLEGALADFAPDVEWTHPNGMNEYGLGGTKQGHREVRSFMARARTVFSEIRPEPHEFVESGDRVIVLGTHHMRGARSGVAGTVRFVHSWRLAGGKVTHFEDHHDTADVRRIVEPQTAASDPCADIIQRGLGFWSAKVLLAAVELGVFTELARQPLDAAELRSRLGVHERGARDFFDALVSFGLLDRDDEQYRNTQATQVFLNRNQPETYIGGLFEVADQYWYRSWENLVTALRTGVPQNNTAKGTTDPFQVLYADPARVRQFQRAMTGGAMPASMALVERFPWTRYRTVADVGCAEGALLGRLLRRYPHLTGVGFDLPPVAPTFQETAARLGLTDRMRFVDGNFFTDSLPPADVVVYGHVLHDWDLDGKRLLLGKAYDVLPVDGVVVIYETLIDDERRRSTAGLLMSLHMLLESPGGFDYTGADCMRWLDEAGFHDCRVEHLAGPDWMIVGTKPRNGTGSDDAR
ncbi:hypothetical protein GCM10012275_47580 [Longimycelium tulufanense]|uniref:Uncharacterized protein n=1 Tax=Longimycelium tulufanense TaxID=907463 RepID=A0A8J3CIE8_9PSEU|nr:methyltransferase [Longimycelium tulufanense]GGM71611.1 hypothetical protein GCM10012275_47580 [Longimycelium tulufanense]